MDLVEITFCAIVFLSTIFVLCKIFNKNTYPPLPGPLSLPIIGHLHLLGPIIHQTFHHLSQNFGPIFQFRLGSVLCVVISTPDLVKTFLKTHELVFSSRNSTTAVNIITKNTSFSFSPYGPYWKFVKKLCAYELLGTRNINHFEPIRRNEINSFLQILMTKGKTGESVNVTAELLKLTSNMISRMTCSIRCSEKEGEAEAARNVVRDVTQIFGEFDATDIIWFDLQKLRKRSEDIRRRYDSLLEKIITDREKMRSTIGCTGEAKDFLDILLNVVENESSEVEFTREHLKGLILDFFTAGTDTTAIATEWTIAELISNPNVLKKAQEEIDNVIGSARLVGESDGPQLPYLMAIIKESFRLHPPVPMLNRKSVSDIVINGYKIPANTQLFVNIWSIGRNPEYWDNPLEFRPERFLGTGIGPVDVKGQNFELLPFGTGRRGCPGMLLAMQELVYILGTMIQCFDWKLADGSKKVDMTERPGLASPRAYDLVCRAMPRIDPVILSAGVPLQ